ncbi:MAG: transglycosylase domain-containing protein [Clostridia bacterium]|nr:transglycosylase domain-containing protein [Clostridia bacterium]
MKFKKTIKAVFIGILFVAIIILSTILIFVTSWINEVKKIDVSISENNINAFYEIYDTNNELINSKEKHEYIKFYEMPQNLINAFISIEDKEFFNHNGLNFKRIVGATINNIKEGSVVEGASTITQQLIKNKYLNKSKSIERKVKEAYLATKIERIEPKQDIFENYLNIIYFGHGAYGINEASSLYFNKQVKNLTLAECSTLAGIIKSPNTYSPVNNIENCKKRRNLVLKEMLKDNHITKEEYTNALAENINIDLSSFENNKPNNLYEEFVLQEASEILNISSDEIKNKRYKIYTYQDRNAQEILNEKINDEKFYQKNKYENIADSFAMITDNDTRGVIAVAGKSKYDLCNFKRQPGSLIKPIFVYAPAIEERLVYPCSEILDEETNFNDYRPRNVSNKYYGYISIKDSIAKSLNVPAVKLCDQLSVEKCKEYSNKAGLSFDESDSGLAVALGGVTNGFTMQTILDSYSPLYNNGNHTKSAFIKKIITPTGIEINNKFKTETRYCKTSTSYLMTESLLYSTKYGTSKKLYKDNYQIASKTGTVNIKDSNDNTDAYCLAYTSDHSMLSWFGNYSMDSKCNLEGSNNGGTFATQIISEVFDELYESNCPSDFSIPDSVVKKDIDTLTLKNEHMVMLMSHGPDRFKQSEFFDIENLPPESNILDTPPIINFNLEQGTNSIIINFEAKDYIKYEIFRFTDSSKEELIEVVSNKNGIQTIYDYSPKNNITYEYYIVSKNTNNNKSSRTPHKAIRYSISYNELLNNSDNISYIFR